MISGDVSISPQRTADGLKPPPFRPDLFVLESTYGGRRHANRASEERRLAATIAEVVTAGGKVLIPAFALGRPQEVMLALNELRRRGEFPAVPVWVDGMVRAICQADSQFPDALPLALQERQARFFAVTLALSPAGRQSILSLAGQTRNYTLIPAPELPQTQFDLLGAVVERHDNSLMLRPITKGPGDASHPLVEVVVVTGSTLVYLDTTSDRTGTIVDGKLQQTLAPFDAKNILPSDTLVAWGQRRGDRLTAEVVVDERHH